jgi:hypothetical protein
MEFVGCSGTDSHRQKWEPTTFIMFGIVALVAVLAGISYGKVNNHFTSQNLTKTVELVAEDTGLNFKENPSVL